MKDKKIENTIRIVILIMIAIYGFNSVGAMEEDVHNILFPVETLEVSETVSSLRPIRKYANLYPISDDTPYFEETSDSVDKKKKKVQLLLVRGEDDLLKDYKSQTQLKIIDKFESSYVVKLVQLDFNDSIVYKVGNKKTLLDSKQFINRNFIVARFGTNNDVPVTLFSIDRISEKRGLSDLEIATNKLAFNKSQEVTIESSSNSMYTSFGIIFFMELIFLVAGLLLKG